MSNTVKVTGESTVADDNDNFGLGKSIPLPRIIKKGNDRPGLKADVLDGYREKVAEAMAGCSSKRDVLEIEVDSLAECVALAAEIYKEEPVPDNAYQLSSLTNAHNSALSQLEKMKDPQVVMSDLETHIRRMFTGIIQSVVGEIHKTKQEFNRLYPGDKATVDDQFARMLEAAQPQTQVLYEELQKAIKTVLGIKMKDKDK